MLWLGWDCSKAALLLHLNSPHFTEQDRQEKKLFGFQTMSTLAHSPP